MSAAKHSLAINSTMNTAGLKVFRSSAVAARGFATGKDVKFGVAGKNAGGSRLANR